jgi:hypothetical protein
MSQYRSDDGSQAWFDAQLRMRAQQRNNQRNTNPLDRRVTPHKDPVVKEAEIHDPYIRDLVARRAEQPHYGPVPLDKEVKTNVDMEAFARQQASLQQAAGPMGEADIDLIFNRNRHQQPQHPLPGQQQQYHQQQPQQGYQQVVLREGYPVYRAIQQAYGNTFILAREVGVVNQQLASQPFLVKGMIQAYVVPQHQQQVNIQEIQRNPQLLSPLVEVHAPPMASLGPLLVPREAVVAPGQYGGGRQMITDSRQHYAPQQPQHYYPNHNGRGILKG